jgi:sugar O-acyltransferase (sialic acid O-acetyltransferase NeuD family)
MKGIIFSTSQTTHSMLDAYRQGGGALQFAGILDDDPDKQGECFYGLQVIGTFREVNKLAHSGQVTHFMIGLGALKHVRIKARLFEYCASLGLQPLNVLGRFCEVSKSSQIGEGHWIGSMTCISTDCLLGRNCFLHGGGLIMEKCILEDNVTIAGNTFIGGLCVIQSNVYIGPGVTVGSEVIIGQNSVIGAGSVVLKNVPPDTFVRGNPPKYVPMRQHAFYLNPPAWMQASETGKSDGPV